ncbi:MAG: PEP-CTERM sorting domain-containing protein, partial [Nitrospira sp.]|nr:PEP-CTERM sorting domain-containing protein [Nitrospira sp.]
ATTFSEAWSNPYLSKGSLYLGPGTYDLDIYAERVADGVNYGSGYIRATNVPEPATILMLGAGILGLGLFQYRKWSRTNS